jgi:hypothetical protein
MKQLNFTKKTQETRKFPPFQRRPRQQSECKKCAIEPYIHVERGRDITWAIWDIQASTTPVPR